MELRAVKRVGIFIVGSLIAGMIGGGLIIWALLVKNLFGFAYGFPLLSPDIENRPITIVQPKEVTLQFDIAVENILNDVSASSAFIFIKKPTATNVISGAYLASEAVGQASAITGDGWFMTAYSGTLENTIVSLPSVTRGIAHPIEQVIKDPHTDTSFFKISLENEIRIAPFSVIDELNQGETVVVIDSLGGAALGTLLSIDTPITRNDIIRSSEKPIKRPVIAIPEGVNTTNAHVYDTSGALIAIGDDEGEFFYTDWDELLPYVLRGEEFARVYTGLHYVLISDLISEARIGIPDVKDGAWILGNAIKAPVVHLSPAAIVGFKEGEIIITVERESVSHDKDLEMLLSQYNPGQYISIGVITNEGIEEERSITLGSY
jgi:S1-C subfamily serine protease